MQPTSLGRLALPAVFALSASASAQLPDIVICTSAGSTAAPQCTDRLIMLRDLNTNGSYNDMPDEIAGFYDSGAFNATFLGIRAAEMRLEAGEPTVYWVDKTTSGLFRGQDANSNGAIDAGEFNAFGPAPALEQNGVCGTADGGIWFSDQVFSSPSASAGVWRLEDLTMDGDAQDAGEAVQVVSNGQTVPATGGPVVIDTAYFQTMASFGNKVVAYSGANIMGADECLYALEDLNSDGDLADAGEVITFLNGTGKNASLDKNPDCGMGLAVKELATNAGAHARLLNFDVATQTTNEGTHPTWYMGTDSSSTSPTFSTNVNGQSLGGLILRGIDLNMDGDVNDAGEVVTWFDGGFSSFNNISKILGLEVHGNSVYVLDLAGGTFSVHQLTDLNNDGDASDPMEFVTVADANLWGGMPPLDACGTNSGPFVVDFAITAGGTWDPPGMPMSPFVTFCTGDGGDQMGCTDCPCSNNAVAGTGGGCLNSAGTGSRLIASGDPSVSLPMASVDDLRFEMTDGPAFSLFILNSGDALAPSNPVNPCFGLGSGAAGAAFDGLRCAISNTLRNGGRGSDSNGEVGVTNAGWGGADNPPGGIAVFFGYASGQTKYFQNIHRDTPAVNCGTGLNTTQAIEVTFTP